MSIASERRIQVENRLLEKLQARSKYISIEFLDSPFNQYVVTYTCTGIYRDEDTKEIRHSRFHQMEVVLLPDFPRTRPILRWITPIFHPNIQSKIILDINTWNVSSTISDFLVPIGEMVQYKRYYPNSAHNRAAAAWAIQNRHLLPIGSENLVEPVKLTITILPTTKP